MNVNQFHNLEDTLGARFLEYVLNYPERLTRRDQIEEYGFTNQQRSGIALLLNLLAMSYTLTPGSALLNYPNLIGEFNAIRRSCGGAAPVYTVSTEPIIGFLLKKAVDCYPILLLMEERSAVATWGRLRPSRLPTTMAENEEIVMLFRHDPELCALLKGDDSVHSARIEYALENSIRVYSFVWSFADDFLQGAFTVCCYRGKYNLPDLLVEVEASLSVLRKIARGESVPVYYFQGIYGMRLNSTADHDLGNGTTLRNIDDLANPSTWGTMSTASTKEQKGILLGCILEHPEQATSIAIDENSKTWTISLTRFTKLVDDFVMSVVLGGQHKQAPIGKTFTDIYVPLYRHLPQIRDNVRGGITGLDVAEVKEVTYWFNLLREVDSEHVRIPVGRIRAALYERTRPIDALLDFFIAWESMFSTKISTTKSVVRSMEVMLARAGKPISRKRLERLYGLRSEIVHGMADEKTNDLLRTPVAQSSVRDEACEVALVVLSELLKDAELLQLQPNERVHRLLSPVKEICDGCKQPRLSFR